MNYIFYIIVFCSIIGIILIPLRFFHHVKADFITKTAIKNILKQKPQFFSEYLIKKVIKAAIKNRSKEQIDLLVQGKILTVASKINKKEQVIKQLLRAFFLPVKVTKVLENEYKKAPKKPELALWLTLIYETTGNKIRSELFWEHVKNKKLPPHLKPYYLSHLGKIATQNGDLEYASQCFYQASDLFHRQRCFYEEAEIYLQLGTIYRISFIPDIAEMLFSSALKLYQKLKYVEGEAKAYANLGMLMVGQERFDEAQSYFEKASIIYDTKQQHIEFAEIQNQQALMYLLKKEYKEAKKLADAAEKKHKQRQNKLGEAFSQEIKANICWEQNKFAKASLLAAAAAKCYQESHQISGKLDSLYLQAQALYKQGKDQDSEDILRQIITEGKKDCGCFYLANAYNLLGTIFIKRRDLTRAKGLFQQSLDLEQRGARMNALATDYANIGLVEMHCGHKERARKNLETALDLAKIQEDKELCVWMQKHLDKLNN